MHGHGFGDGEWHVRNLKVSAFCLAPAFFLVLAWCVLDQFHYTGGPVAESLTRGGEVVWPRYYVATTFLLHVVTCVGVCFAAVDSVVERLRNKKAAALPLGGAAATLVVLCLGEVTFSRERLEGALLATAAVGDIGAGLALFRTIGNGLLGLTVGVLAGVILVIAPGGRSDEDSGYGSDCWERWKEAHSRIGHWDRLLLHAVAFSVTGVLFMDSRIRWPMRMLSVDSEGAWAYEEIAKGLAGYSAVVLTLLLAVIFLPTRVWLRREVRALGARRHWARDLDADRDLPWRVRILVMAPVGAQAAVEIVRIGL